MADAQNKSALCLSPDELKDLTGYARQKQQTDWLRERGYPFEVGGDGVKVLRSYVVNRLGGKIDSIAPRPRINL